MEERFAEVKNGLDRPSQDVCVSLASFIYELSTKER